MNLLEKASTLIPGRGAHEPRGTIHVVDPSPLNWLYITYNTVEEFVRVTDDGLVRPAAMESYGWVDDLTLEIKVREGNRFPDGELITAATAKRAFDEMIRWRSPHPPGTHFNHDPRTTCEVVDESTVRMHLPDPDGAAVGKLRAMHIMSSRFWEEVGFGYKRQGSGEGHW